MHTLKGSVPSPAGRKAVPSPPRIARRAAITSGQSRMYANFGERLRGRTGLSSVATCWSEGVAVERWILPPIEEFRNCMVRHRVAVFLGRDPMFYNWNDGGHPSGGVMLPGAFSLMPAGLTTVTQWRQPMHVASFEFSPSLVEQLVEGEAPAPSEQLIGCRNVNDPVLFDLTCRVVAELEAPSEPLYGEMLCLALVMQLMELRGRIGIKPPRRGERLSPLQARRVLDYAHAHLGDCLSISSLARVAGLSAAHFARAFRATFKESPHRRILRWRLERAAGMVIRRGASLAEAAVAAGFCDQAHFTHAMRLHFDMTPGSLLRN
jgi:AraC family transcriptional regulator